MLVRRVADPPGLSCLEGAAQGELVVLLHGLAGSAVEMAPLAGTLVGAGHRVVVPDQRGHGHSERFPADVSREAYVGDVLAPATTCTWTPPRRPRG